MLYPSPLPPSGTRCLNSLLFLVGWQHAIICIRMYINVRYVDGFIVSPRYTTIAHGLAAPFAGPISFEHVKAFVDEVVLVSDDDLREATRYMFGAFVHL